MKFPTIKSKKDSLYITLFFLFSIACIAGLRYEQRLEMQKGIAEKIIRFHVIANSDTKADQNLKLSTRAAVYRMLTVDRLCKYLCDGRLTGSPGSTKQIRMPDPVCFDLVF